MHDRYFPESGEYPDQFPKADPQRDREDFDTLTPKSIAENLNEDRIRELEQRVEMFDEAVVIWLAEQLGITHKPVNVNEEGDVEDVLMVVSLGTVEFAASGPGYMAALRNLLVMIFDRSGVALTSIVLPLYGLSELNVEGNDDN